MIFVDFIKTDMKNFLFIFLILFAINKGNAQITSYSSYDNEETVVYEVEDMESYEIKDYNRWAKEGYTNESSLMYINAYRAQINLIDAPATIIKYYFIKNENESDPLVVDVELINSTTKTIKEITLEFEFDNATTPVYDIKTGDSYLVLKYSNLSGRTKSDLYDEVANTVLKSYHYLKYKDATYKKLFYNKKATVTRLHSAKIKYIDGTTSTKIAVFQNGSLLENGPLSPFVKYLEYIEKKRIEEETKKNTTTETTDEIANKKVAEEKAREKTIEEETRKKKAAEEAARRKAAEEAVRKKAAMEAAKKKEEARKKAAEEEARRKAAIEAAKKKAAEEAVDDAANKKEDF